MDESKERFGVWIIWGTSPERGTEMYYEFETPELLGAFLYGVDECDGWMDYRTFDTEEEVNTYFEEREGILGQEENQ